LCFQQLALVAAAAGAVGVWLVEYLVGAAITKLDTPWLELIIYHSSCKVLVV
jgi:hypothetical protein